MATISGTLGNDSLFGTPQADIILAQDGNDFIEAFEGADSILGNQGNDFIDGGADNDTIRGGKDNDTLLGNEGFDELHGEAGDDSLVGGPGLDLMYGGDGNDVLFGDDGTDVMFGNSGNDTIEAGGGNNRARGGKDDDQIFGRDGNDTLFGDLGNDLVNGGKDNDSIRGGKGNDQLFGELGDDTISGDLDSDTIFGGDGNDSILGGNDNKTEDGGDRLFGEAGNDTIFGQLGDDELAGGDGNDSLHGGSGRDVISGDVGNDTLFGGEGDFEADTLIGGADGDIFVVTANSGGSTLVDADVVLDFSAGEDSLALAGTDAFANQGTGENANDVIIRRALNDTLPGEFLLVLKNVTVDAIVDDDSFQDNVINDFLLPEEPISPTPTPPTPTPPTPTPPTPTPPTPTPTDSNPMLVGAEVLAANSSTPTGTLASLTATDASTFELSNAAGNTGQDASNSFQIQGNNLNLVNSGIFEGNMSVDLTIEALDTDGTALGTTTFTVYRMLDEAINDSAINDGEDISDGTGQDTILVASGTYDGENLPSTTTTTLKFSSLNDFELVLNTLPRTAGNIDGVLVGTSNVDNLTGEDSDDIFLGGGDSDNLIGGGGENTFIYINQSDGGASGDNLSDFTSEDRIFVEATAFGLTETADRGTLANNRFAALEEVDAANPADGTDNNVRFVYDLSNNQLYFDSNGENAGGGNLLARLPADFVLENDNIVVFPEANI